MEMKTLFGDRIGEVNRALVSIITISLFFGCQSEYHRRVESELASGVRKDSLFLGISFGMSSKEFYAHCWELNKEGVIQQGSQNTTVLYEGEELPYLAEMNFYPNFYQDKIYEMPVTYNYKAWAPWNRHLFADSLQRHILNLYQQRYGEDFLTIEHPERGVAYVRVDGNRRINIYRESDSEVKVLFTDLEVEALAEEKKKLSSER